MNFYACYINNFYAIFTKQKYENFTNSYFFRTFANP